MLRDRSDKAEQGACPVCYSDIWFVWLDEAGKAVYSHDPDRKTKAILPHADFRLPCKGTGQEPQWAAWFQ